MDHMKKMMEQCMGMMGKCGPMDFKKEGTANMMNMCYSMMGGKTNKPDDLAEYSTSELKDIFEDWLVQLEEEIIEFANQKEKIIPEEVMSKFKLGRKSVDHILKKLAQKNKINIDDIQNS